MIFGATNDVQTLTKSLKKKLVKVKRASQTLNILRFPVEIVHLYCQRSLKEVRYQKDGAIT